LETFFKAERTFCCTIDSSIILPMKIVQVISEANARPIITPFTTTSADMNIDHGDNSVGMLTFGLLDAFSADGAGAPPDAGAAAWRPQAPAGRAGGPGLQAPGRVRLGRRRAGMEPRMAPVRIAARAPAMPARASQQPPI